MSKVWDKVQRGRERLPEEGVGMYGIVISRKDPVAQNALPILLEKGFSKLEDGIFQKDDVLLVERENDVLHLEELDVIANKWELDYFVVVSRHKAERGIKTLTVHPTGNFGEAKYGGRDRELGMAYANGMQRIFIELLNRNPGDYQVSLEVTHHGPTEFNTPLMFVEIGSTEKEWQDLEAVEALVMSVLEGGKRKKKSEVAIGFGGGHYAPKFTPLEETVAFGHMCPKYNADKLDLEMVKQMVERTSDGVDFALIDEKGLKGQQRVLVKGWLDELGVEHQMI